jgi:EpsI family protein
MTTRVLLVVLCLLAGGAVLARAAKSEAVPIRQSFTEFPVAVGAWQGQQLPDFEDRIVRVLGVDEYLNRVYYRDRRPMGLYVGYYNSQRQGDTMHSPLNCLPGAGWLPAKQGRATLDVDDGSGRRQIEINDFIIEKGLDRQVVLYWYQSRGRVVASEYWGKIYTVVDAVRMNRTDGALVRVVTPVIGSGAEAERQAQQAALGFVRELFPQLRQFLPA